MTQSKENFKRLNANGVGGFELDGEFVAITGREPIEELNDEWDYYYHVTVDGEGRNWLEVQISHFLAEPDFPGVSKMAEDYDLLFADLAS